MRRSYRLPLGAVLIIAAGLVVYSQTAAFAFDEGFHLVAAQLIRGGKRPYLDFLFPQTPLNAYWNALWMRLLADNWRVVHGLAALETAAAVVLAMDYVFRRLPERLWGAPSALFVACSIGLNVAVVQFGTIGQAYGLCLLLSVAAFRATVMAVERPSLWLPAAGGLLATAAAASSLLCAPFAPVLLIWLLLANSTGSRLAKAGAFVAGALIALLPVLRLLAQSPGRVLFGIFKYHLFFRQVDWTGAYLNDLGVALGWIDCGQALILIAFAVGGVLFVRRSGWDRSVRAELYLCTCLIVAVTIHLLSAHPTFSRYFLLTVPFLAILASVGVCALGERLGNPGRPYLAAGIASLLMLAGMTKMLYDGRDDFAWSDIEALSVQVDAVTPPGAPIYADELVYFVTRRVPPEGMECHDSHKLTILSKAEAADLHVVPAPERDRMVNAGAFSTVETCDDDEISRFAHLYSHKAEHAGCAVYWGFK